MIFLFLRCVSTVIIVYIIISPLNSYLYIHWILDLNKYYYYHSSEEEYRKGIAARKNGKAAVIDDTGEKAKYIGPT